MKAMLDRESVGKFWPRESCVIPNMDIDRILHATLEVSDRYCEWGVGYNLYPDYISDDDGNDRIIFSDDDREGNMVRVKLEMDLD